MCPTTKVAKCKHGIEYDSCSFCTGYVSPMEKMREKNLQEVHDRLERKTYEMHTKLMATRHNAPYTDGEFRYIIRNTFEVEKRDVRKLYQIALDLSRTLGAIEWIWNYIWEDKITDILKEGIDNAMWDRIQKLKENMFGGKC